MIWDANKYEQKIQPPRKHCYEYVGVYTHDPLVAVIGPEISSSALIQKMLDLLKTKDITSCVINLNEQIRQLIPMSFQVGS